MSVAGGSSWVERNADRDFPNWLVPFSWPSKTGDVVSFQAQIPLKSTEEITSTPIPVHLVELDDWSFRTPFAAEEGRDTEIPIFDGKRPHFALKSGNYGKLSPVDSVTDVPRKWVQSPLQNRDSGWVWQKPKEPRPRLLQ